MSTVRIIGDVHGKYQEYIALTKGCDYSIQIGDMGFNYDAISNLDGACHKFFRGNHDNYDTYWQDINTFGYSNYGYEQFNGFQFFYVGGGFSIDWKQRQQAYLAGGPKTYWDKEELGLESMYNAIDKYKMIKPRVVISHECPRIISKEVGNNEILEVFGYNPRTFTTRTSELLQMMFEYHRPEYWFFGHYHRNWAKNVNGTDFRCIDELSYVDFEYLNDKFH